MSELDADLYGDLYGNDEGDFAGATDAVELKAEEPMQSLSDTPADIQPTSSVKVELKQTPVSTSYMKQEIPTEPIPVQHQELSAISSTPQPIPTPSYSPQVTQQIPTYQQPQPAEYLESPMPQSADGAYPRGQLPERTIRPSEMKDEGGKSLTAVVSQLDDYPCVVTPSSSRLATQLCRLGLG
ncbi:hypothetical protein SERLA73DRAFT_70619 [Serpula lacrymans var. lacrymans S7.3]|uniref:Uncharacterized protein n=2 Tax=Serpula lacrymans var. lacrymans TaxID=341189 RepID=F8PPR4_SERL3|nr:uncharacterized protein SERLADRAFT_434837 [Serpula lacrymans var. lacrymans S7.9]EGO01431.1 hypothetical protein SERLA73DRAFT_70619 [Serpula lacrymans var. lacrymans S7.3]EGO27060.1 hypothetical protein SERLADRAFT_434837 [Serpula lacrymans var. lacrymans S7.9]